MRFLKNGKSFLLLAIVALVASACGGGGGKNTTSGVTTNNVTTSGGPVVSTSGGGGGNTSSVDTPVELTMTATITAHTDIDKISINASFSLENVTLYYAVSTDASLFSAVASLDAADVVDPTIYLETNHPDIVGRGNFIVEGTTLSQDFTVTTTESNVVVVVAAVKGDAKTEVRGARVTLVKDSATQEEGTEQYPWRVDSVEELLQICGLNTLTGFGNRNHHYKLTTDLDLSGVADFVGLCRSTSSESYQSGSFGGVLDGDNHELSGLNIVTDNAYAGLFSYTAMGSIVKNLKLSNFNISAGFYAGALVGEGRGIIENVHVGSSTIKTTQLRGTGTDASTRADNANVGGIAGRISAYGDPAANKNAVIRNSSVYDSFIISSENRPGGIVGTISHEARQPYYSVVENNSFVGSVATLSGQRVGGIVGWARQALIQNNFFEGVITGAESNNTDHQSDFGGIVGYYEGWQSWAAGSGYTAGDNAILQPLVGLKNNITNIVAFNSLSQYPARLANIAGFYNKDRGGSDIVNNFGVSLDGRVNGTVAVTFVSSGNTITLATDYANRNGEVIVASDMVDADFYTNKSLNWSDWNISDADGQVRPVLPNSYDTGKTSKDYNMFIGSVAMSSSVNQSTKEISVNYNIVSNKTPDNVYLVIASKNVELETNEVLEIAGGTYTGAKLTSDDIVYVEDDVTGSGAVSDTSKFDFATDYYLYVVVQVGEFKSNVLTATNKIGDEPVVVVGCTSGGAATEADPFKICSTTDLTSNVTADAGKYYKLMENLDFNDSSARATALLNITFSGNFDGNGKTISGVKVSKASGETTGGLFNVIDSGTVTNLVLSEFEVEAYDRYIGILAGDIKGGVVSNIKILDSKVDDKRADATITKQSSLGALAGRVGVTGSASSTITNVQIGQPADLQSSATGGVFVSVKPTTGTRTASTGLGDEVGGAIGLIDLNSATTATKLNQISNIVSYATVESMGTNVGGVLGSVVSANASNIVGYGSVKAWKSVGGAIGRVLNHSSRNAGTSPSYENTSVNNIFAFNKGIMATAIDEGKFVHAAIGAFQPRNSAIAPDPTPCKILVTNVYYNIDPANIYWNGVVSDITNTTNHPATAISSGEVGANSSSVSGANGTLVGTAGSLTQANITGVISWAMTPTSDAVWQFVDSSSVYIVLI